MERNPPFRTNPEFPREFPVYFEGQAVQAAVPVPPWADRVRIYGLSYTDGVYYNNGGQDVVLDVMSG